MPGDNNIRVSLKPRPLKALFSKYAPQAATTTLPVRPLGVVRRPGSSQSAERAILPSEQELTDLERVCLYLEGGGMDGNKIPYLTSAKYLARVLNGSHEEKGLPKLSKSQTFENQYKLAASRGNLSGLRTPPRSNAKRLITLPMYRVKVNTNNIELEDSEAVESTRKSLRNLMEVGKINASHPDNGVVTANIRNFQFNDLGQKLKNGTFQLQRFKPGILGAKHRKEDTVSSSNITGQNQERNAICGTVHSSEAEPILENTKTILLDNQSLEEVKRQPETDLDRMEVRLESVAYTPTVMSQLSTGKRSKSTPSKSERSVSFKDDKATTSPATRVTASTTLEYLRKTTPFVPGIVYDYDCRRSLPESMESTSPLQVWPSLRDIHSMKVEACRQASRARRRRRNHSSGTGSSVEAPVVQTSPTLRYTKQARNRVLDPIIVPSHTNIDCPMCKLHHDFPDSSSCPPNSPTCDNSSCPPNTLSQICDTNDMDSQNGEYFNNGNAVLIPTAGIISDDDTSECLSSRETVNETTGGLDMQPVWSSQGLPVDDLKKFARESFDPSEVTEKLFGK